MNTLLLMVGLDVPEKAEDSPCSAIRSLTLFFLPQRLQRNFV